jgi:hypothetical protein
MSSIVHYRHRPKRPRKAAKPATIAVPVIVSRLPGKYRGRPAEGAADPEAEASVREFMERMIKPRE